MDHEDDALHALNNILGKILGSAELALDLTEDPALRAELVVIADMAEQASGLVGPLAERSSPNESILEHFR